MKESTARIGDGRRDTTTTMIGLEVNAFRAVGRKSIKVTFLHNVISTQNSSQNLASYDVKLYSNFNI